jgi:hypothetical protein
MRADAATVVITTSGTHVLAVFPCLECLIPDVERPE